MKKKLFQFPKISKEYLVIALLATTGFVCWKSASACSIIQTPVMMVLTYITAKHVATASNNDEKK